MHPPAEFIAAAAAQGLEFEASELQRLAQFLALLLDANTRFNLTAITDPAQAWTRHVLDSLTLLPLLEAADAKRVIDVGAGGGLPGLPLAMTLPNVEFTLLEATGKKARFLQEAVAALGMTNVVVVNDRAEVVGQDHQRHRERYDAVLARAVGRLPVLLELTVPLARVGGLVLAIKGEKAAEEIAEAKAALHLLHAAVSQTLRTPTGTIVVIEKLRATPRLYPRQPGEPKRLPLGLR